MVLPRPPATSRLLSYTPPTIFPLECFGGEVLRCFPMFPEVADYTEDDHFMATSMATVSPVSFEKYGGHAPVSGNHFGNLLGGLAASGLR